MEPDIRKLSEKWIRRLLSAAGLLLCLLLACGRGSERHSAAPRREEVSALREKLAQLEKEKTVLRQEISRRKREEGLETGMAGVGELIILGADQRILSEIVPLIREHSKAAASLAFSETDHPGLPGKLEIQEFRALKKEGWTACLYWDGNKTSDWDENQDIDRGGKEDLDRWLLKMEERFREIGEPFPKSVVFAEGSYAPEMDQVLSGHGITIAVHHGEGGLPLMCGADMENEIWHPGAAGYYDMITKQKPDYLEQAEDLWKNIVYTVCAAEDTSEPGGEIVSGLTSSSIFEAGSSYEKRSFARFMGYWDKDTLEGYLTPKELYEARDHLYRCSLPEADAELLDDEIRGKRERIAEIDDTIRALYEEYYRETEQDR